MLSTKLKLSIAAVAALFGTYAMADTGFKVPVHYNVELVDGVENSSQYSNFSRMITFAPGKHQVVLTFKDTFKAERDTRLVDSPNAVVINIEDLRKDEVLTFKYRMPVGYEQARAYADQQKIVLVDYETEKPVPATKAGYFVLTSDRGFTMMRDYKQELKGLGRLYAPTDVPDSERGVTMTKYGTPTIRASADSYSGSATQGLTMEPLSSSTSSMRTSAVGGGSVAGPSYNELVNMYNSADDATKLKFVKYVMSH